jgi:hypothetical protein
MGSDPLSEFSIRERVLIVLSENRKRNASVLTVSTLIGAGKGATREEMDRLRAEGHAYCYKLKEHPRRTSKYSLTKSGMALAGTARWRMRMSGIENVLDLPKRTKGGNQSP